MLDKVKRYIQTNNLLTKDRLHIVALSGGADSVCLMRLLLKMGYDIHAAHCNFHLRGEESNRDEAFCKQLCGQYGVHLHLVHFDTKTYADTHKVSIEMAARELRYNYFEQLRVAVNAESIVVAHHRDDSVETVLINLLRGTGIQGLQGIRPRNGHIIRPLLCVSREEIVNFLTVLSQPYITDSSNLVDDVMRNKIRLNLIPLLKDIVPAAVENIARTAQNVQEAAKIIEHTINDSIEQCLTEENGYATFTRKEVLAQPSPEQFLFSILTRYGFSPQQATQIYSNINVPSGRIWYSATHILASDRNTFIIGPKQEDDDEKAYLKIPESGIYIYNRCKTRPDNSTTNKEEIRFSVQIEKKAPDFIPSRDKQHATLDADKVQLPLTIRRVRSGDRFVPFGMKGSKLVSDYLTDRKKNYFQRRSQLVVEDAGGQIVWLVGERTSQKAACSDNTIKIMSLRFLK